MTGNFVVVLEQVCVTVRNSELHLLLSKLKTTTFTTKIKKVVIEQKTLNYNLKKLHELPEKSPKSMGGNESIIFWLQLYLT